MVSATALIEKAGAMVASMIGNALKAKIWPDDKIDLDGITEKLQSIQTVLEDMNDKADYR